MIKNIFSCINRNEFYLTFCLFFMLGCVKVENDKYIQPDSYLTYFESLTSEKDTLLRGESTTIIAKAFGNKISYLWTASEGQILGVGSQVIFMASPCCYGNIVITCEVKARFESTSKSLSITVLE